MKNNKGQTLYYFLIFTMILVISWAMMLNIAKLIRDRMNMQILADNTALSIATHKARIMNFVGACNYLIGTIIALGTEPNYTQIPSYNTDIVGAYITGDTKKNGFHDKEYKDVKRMKTAIEALQKLQELAMESHLTYVSFLAGNFVSKGYGVTISPLKLPSVANAEKVFGVKRNPNPIKYLYTYNADIFDVDIVYNPYPITSPSDLLKIIQMFEKNFNIDVLSGDGLNKIKDFIFDGVFGQSMLFQFENFFGFLFNRKVYDTTEHSWYITDENFHKQKVMVNLTNENFLIGNRKNRAPIFANLLNISKPYIQVRSAAAIYNTKGTMFPEEAGKNTGLLEDKLFTLYEGFFLLRYASLVDKIYEIDILPYKLLTIAAAAYMASMNIYYIFEAKKEKNSPIQKYLDSKDGGWTAHLVPYRVERDDE